MKITGEHKEWVLNKVRDEIFGYLCEISNESQHRYPAKFGYNPERTKRKIEELNQEIRHLLNGFGHYLKLTTLVVDFFDNDNNNDTHWDTPKHRENMQYYLNDVIKIYRRDRIIELLEEDSV